MVAISILSGFTLSRLQLVGKLIIEMRGKSQWNIVV